MSVENTGDLRLPEDVVGGVEAGGDESRKFGDEEFEVWRDRFHWIPTKGTAG